VITAVEIRGGEVADEPDLEEGLASREDEIFDVDVLEKDLERIRRFYRSHGYYEASVSAARGLEPRFDPVVPVKLTRVVNTPPVVTLKIVPEEDVPPFWVTP